MSVYEWIIILSIFTPYGPSVVTSLPYTTADECFAAARRSQYALGATTGTVICTRRRKS